jgi:hypothetical protein
LLRHRAIIETVIEQLKNISRSAVLNIPTRELHLLEIFGSGSRVARYSNLFLDRRDHL